jgi:soluble lytic murein transglycosylase-like protein
VRPTAATPEIVGKPAAEIPPSCLTPSPLAPEAIEALIVRVAGEEGADARLAIAVARQESGFDRNRVSSKGALGAMQLMPATAASYGITDPCDPEQNVRGGIKHLAKLTREFGNPLLVLAAYNAGEGRVYEHKGLPPFRETLTFVSRIANEYYGFTNAVIRPSKGGRPGTAVVDASATAAPPGRSREPAPDKPDTSNGPKWIGGHVLNFD